MCSAVAAAPPSGRESLVAVENISKRYGRTTVVTGVTLTLRAGEICGFIGPNGSGKTTTLRILAGILKPDGGRGHVLGFDLQHDAAKIREQVGYMSQRLSLYAELSVFENLRFRAEVYGLRNLRAAVAAAISEFGLAPWTHCPAGSLSGGWHAGFSSLRRWFIRRVSCSWMNQRRVSMRRPARRYGGAWKHWRQPARA